MGKPYIASLVILVSETAYCLTHIGLGSYTFDPWADRAFLWSNVWHICSWFAHYPYAIALIHFGIGWKNWKIWGGTAILSSLIWRLLKLWLTTWPSMERQVWDWITT